MIAVAVSVFVAVYVLGPDALSRFLLGIAVPRRNVILSRSEEFFRALVGVAGSLTVALLWLRLTGALHHVWRPGPLRIFFAGLYSEAFFRENQALWFGSLRDVFWMNWSVLWRLYAVTALVSIGLAAATLKYGRIRHRLAHEWQRESLAALVLPGVAQWHVLLSRLSLPDRRTAIHLDILTKSDKLYQGSLLDKALAADGSLVSVILGSPKRFDRQAYLKAKDAGGGRAETTQFWKDIPTEMFVVMASDINTINIRYVSRQNEMAPLKRDSPELMRLLEAIADEVNAMRERGAGEGKPEDAGQRGPEQVL